MCVCSVSQHSATPAFWLVAAALGIAGLQLLRLADWEVSLLISNIALICSTNGTDPMVGLFLVACAFFMPWVWDLEHERALEFAICEAPPKLERSMV